MRGCVLVTNERSCGALVYRFHENHREFLLIKHRFGGHIGFPKGHMEKNEEPIETAYREIFEETGIKTYLYPNIKTYSHYDIGMDIHKAVTFFIGRPLNDDIIHQPEEISEAFWCPENQVRNALTHDGTKAVFDRLIEDIHRLEKDVSLELMTYVEKNVLPQYDQFDEGHHRDHIYEVVNASFDLVEDYPARKDMVYLVACYHDLGLQFGRETHHITSGELLQKDPYVTAHYSNEDIQIMVDAIYDHRASNTHEPRTIYGKILAEADRLLDVKKVIERTVLYELHRHPQLSREGQIKNAFDHIIDKYGNQGYLKRYLDYEPNRIGEQALIHLSNDEKLLYQTLKQTFEKLSQ